MKTRRAETSGELTVMEIARLTGIPRSTVYRDIDRVRDLIALEAVFQALPRTVQRKWLRNKLATA